MLRRMAELSSYRANVSFNNVQVGEVFDADPDEMAPLVDRGLVSAVASASPTEDAEPEADGERSAPPDADAAADLGLDAPRRRSRKKDD